MESTQFEIDRLLIFEHARATAEAAYAINPKDADNLTKWGGALLELSQFAEPNEAKRIIKEAVSKLEEALSINPAQHEALWCLGNAHSTSAFLTPERDEAHNYFERASECFQKAVNECPGNEHYLQSLAHSTQAPGLHDELRKQGGLSQTLGSGHASSSKAKSSTKKKSSDLTYDICGWIILAVGLVVWIGVAKSHAPR